MTNTTQYANGWVPDPNGRGTWQILYSCVFTLFICVYSAIHINIPARGEPKNAQFWRKVKWAFIAIFAPEVVLYSAWQQYYIASRFCRDLYNIQLEQAGLPAMKPVSWWSKLIRLFFDVRPHEPNRKRQPFSEPTDPPATSKGDLSSSLGRPTKLSLTYGFYVVMGGLVVDVGDVYDNVPWATLTPAGVLHFATKIGWERFSVGDQTIRDKSKADILAKVLVILQVSRSLFQCITRQASGYPLTVLEVHILVHAACAMLMYALWFRKPLDVGDPSSVDMSSAAENVALSLMRSSGTAFRPFTALESQTQFETSNVGAVRQVFMELLFSPLRALRRRPKHASEADFLIFDMDCLHAVQERPSDSEDQVVSVLDNLADGQRVQGRKSACVGDLGQPRKTGQVAAAPSPTLMNPVDLESQSHRGVVGQDATFHRQSLVDDEPATVLVTGQTLTSGIGPGVVQTTSNETLSFSLRTRLARVTGLNRLAPSRLEIHEIDALLNPLLGWPLGLPKFPSFFLDHKVAICLSQKDLLRWRLAGFAIAREARINSSMLARFDQRGAITFSPELWRNSRGNEHYRPHRRLQPLSEKSWPYPPDLIGSLGDFILRSPNLSREPIWVLLDTDTYYYSSANGEAERASRLLYS
ncbi:hypothetical protein LTR10_019379 [Elasticomyces elasticus]|uniref:Uncharacterized protein n=1 Tax=Exophiala sideris TaxID=1016849 RepID=A0ABR0IWT2_9EURO|nr:hypothetical protein LTR10_019379 [Elasticomyces elasticus]KAK5021420.1 hypothetical protein LTS07_011030 [Exophiala sideris]KAK5025418.1 hypothetical protein LTR13_010495 [Exophiala sideris]KAK5049269.1 hypothetical protein LTR69_011054 [Exophiala sideris]KAK5176942.1 hypothetical protein LTR44_010515 [Eurotiomycetes sp. CCFEE 6388]